MDLKYVPMREPEIVEHATNAAAFYLKEKQIKFNDAQETSDAVQFLADGFFMGVRFKESQLSHDSKGIIDEKPTA